MCGTEIPGHLMPQCTANRTASIGAVRKDETPPPPVMNSAPLGGNRRRLERNRKHSILSV